MSYGVTATGFVSKTTVTVLADLQAAAKSELGAELNTEADSLMGILLGIFADELGELWEVASGIYASRNPDSATGVPLDNVCAITGTVRSAATKSTAVVTVTATGAVSTVPAGTFVVSVDGNPDARFVNVEDIAFGGAGSTDYDFEAETAGVVVANSGTLTVIETPVSGISSTTNAADATTGTDVETDVALRLRRETELDAIGSGTLDTMRARLSEVDDDM